MPYCLSIEANIAPPNLSPRTLWIPFECGFEFGRERGIAQPVARGVGPHVPRRRTPEEHGRAILPELQLVRLEERALAPVWAGDADQHGAGDAQHTGLHRGQDLGVR